jgi:release factor glutamine methyltransferase
MHTIRDIVVKSAQWLGTRGVESPRLDAELLLAHVLGCERLKLYLDWDKPLTELEVAAMRELIRRRGTERAPVSRLVGKREFYGRKFAVDEGVFSPRPETEGLVDRALDLLDSDPAMQVERPVVFDVGCGSGCVIVTLAAERPTKARYLASDVSPAAIASAGRNAKALDVQERVELREGALLAGYEGPLHILVSNPPYVKTTEKAELPPEVRDHDPDAALYSGEDGLDCTRALEQAGARLLVPGGAILLELGEDHEELAVAIFSGAAWREARMERDHAGRPRYLVARKR